MDGPSHDPAMEAVDPIDQSGDSVIDEGRVLRTILGEGTFFVTEKMLKSLIHLLS